MDLSVIIVGYNAEKFLPDCLNSLKRDICELSHEIFVVDNSPGESTVQLLRRDFPEITLVKPEENIGFAAGNNRAIYESKGDYILLLNPDTVVMPGSVMSLIEFMRHHPDAGLVAGMLLNGDGSVQHSIRNFPTVLNQLGECFFLYRLPLRSTIFSEMTRDIRAYEKERTVDWVTGAQLLVRREVIEQVDVFDERFFLYSEEQDWCYRIKEAGWQLYYTPKARFVHYLGESSTNQNLYSQLLVSKALFFKKHYGPAKAGLLKKILVLGVFIRAVGWRTLALMGLPRDGNLQSKAFMHAFGLSQIAFKDPERHAPQVKERITDNV